MAATAMKLANPTTIKIADLVTEWTGNRFLDKHYVMIESRLTRRLIHLKLETLEDYYNYLKEHEDDEKEHLISLLTTHHTYFFRESSHFDFIKDNILPAIAKEVEMRPDKTINILSMACSKGHEVYSLATYLDYNLKKFYPKLDFKITATDVDIQSVNHAVNGVYAFEELKRIPMQYLEGYWVRGKGDISNFAKIKNEIKKKCEFYADNLLSIAPKTCSKKYDIVLCRNVFIYFDQPKILEITNNLMKLLTPMGHFIVGISESLRGLNDQIVPVGPSVYCNKSTVPVPKPSVQVPVPTMAPAATPAKLPNPIRVLCVDDSPTIHAVLSKILSEKNGFKIVGKAMNGQEASEFLKKNEVDALTLDIHMPIMGGIEYLEKHFGKSHPPIVMMTSVTRENSDLAFKALTLGASDYVEKPTLHNMKEISLELITKLQSSVLNKVQYMDKAFDKQFTKNLSILKPEECLNIVYGTMMDREKIKELIMESYNKGIETVVVWGNAKKEEDGIISSFFKQWEMTAMPATATSTEKISYCLNMQELNTLVGSKYKTKTKVVTSVTAQAIPSFFQLAPTYDTRVIIEETPNLDISKVKRSWNVYPLTSMAYTIFEIFAK